MHGLIHAPHNILNMGNEDFHNTYYASFLPYWAWYILTRKTNEYILGHYKAFTSILEEGFLLV